MARDTGRDELLQARRQSRGLYWIVGLFSFFANLLMLTGPIYMLQVYDRVLGSRSEATLVALIPAGGSWRASGHASRRRSISGCSTR